MPAALAQVQKATNRTRRDPAQGRQNECRGITIRLLTVAAVLNDIGSTASLPGQTAETAANRWPMPTSRMGIPRPFSFHGPGSSDGGSLRRLAVSYAMPAVAPPPLAIRHPPVSQSRLSPLLSPRRSVADRQPSRLPNGESIAVAPSLGCFTHPEHSRFESDEALGTGLAGMIPYVMHVS